MTPAETAQLVRLVRQACPAQKFEDGTPVLWHKMLEDLRYADCQDAVVEVGKRQPFISPSEIRDEVRRIRNDRIRAVPSSELEPADIDPNDLEAYQAARLQLIHRIGDGEPLPERPALVKRPVAQLIESAAERTEIPAPDYHHTTVAREAARLSGAATTERKRARDEREHPGNPGSADPHGNDPRAGAAAGPDTRRSASPRAGRGGSLRRVGGVFGGGEHGAVAT